MKLTLIYGLIFIFSFELKSQPEVVVRGSVKDSNNNPIPFSSITLEDYSRGTYCDINGNFILKINQLPVIIEISNVGYETERMLVEKSSSMGISIILLEKKIILNEVLITDTKVKPKRIGSPKKNKGMLSLGVVTSFEQLGLMIRNKDNQLYSQPVLLTVSFKIKSAFAGNRPNGNRQLRLRIYDIENNADVGKDILYENIFLSPKKKGWYKIDIQDRNLIVPQKGFVIAVEWLENQPIHEWNSEKYTGTVYGVDIAGHQLSDEEKQFYSTMRFRSITTGWQKPTHIVEREQYIPCFQLEFIELNDDAR